MDKIWVSTDNPAAGTSSTQVDVYQAADRVKYEVAESKWYERGSTTEVNSSNPFNAAKTYDLVVKVKAQPGYKFNETTFGKDVAAELKTGSSWDACVNKDIIAPEFPQNAIVETKLAKEDGRDVIYIRYSSFKPIDKTPVRIDITEGELDNTIYYAITTPDKQSDDSDIKAGVVDHKSGVNAIFSDANTKSPIKFKVTYTDASGQLSSGVLDYDSATCSIVYRTSATTYVPISNGYVFTNILSASKTVTDQATYDGQNLYLAYTPGGNTLYAGPLGVLTVRELQADGITATGKDKVTLRYEKDNTNFAAEGPGLRLRVRYQLRRRHE